MSRFLTYAPEPAYLLPPPAVGDELGTDPLCFFVRRGVEHRDRSGFGAGVQRGRGRVVPSGDDVERVVVWVCGGG